MSDVLITDVRYRYSIPVIRDLAAAGFRVVCAEYSDLPKHLSLGFYSKYCADTLLLTEENAVNEINRKCASLNSPVILPIGAKTTAALSKSRPEYPVLLPKTDALERAGDKLFVVRSAEEVGIRVPKTRVLGDYESLAALSDDMKYPAVIKYRNGEALMLKVPDRYVIVKNRDEFIAEYTKMNERQSDPLAQEYIGGAGFGVSMVITGDGNIADFICHKRLREYPASGGPSSCCEAVFSRDMLVSAAALVKKIGLTGVAMIEFRGDAEKPYLMEINPRFWGSSPLIEAAHSSFYRSVVSAALGKAVTLDPKTAQPAYRVGAKMRFFPQDLIGFGSNFRQSDSKLRFTASYLASVLDPRVRDGVFRLRDPAPYIRYLKNGFGGDKH